MGKLLARVLVGTTGVLKIDDVKLVVCSGTVVVTWLIDDSMVIGVDTLVGLLEATIVGEKVFNELDSVDIISDDICASVMVLFIGGIVVSMLVD